MGLGSNWVFAEKQVFLIIGCAGGWMAFDQEAVVDVDLTSSVLIALLHLLFGEQQALVGKSLDCPFL